MTMGETVPEIMPFLENGDEEVPWYLSEAKQPNPDPLANAHTLTHTLTPYVLTFPHTYNPHTFITMKINPLSNPSDSRLLSHSSNSNCPLHCMCLMCWLGLAWQWSWGSVLF